MKTKFTISSHIEFHEKTYPIIVKSLIDSGVPPKDIYFFIGGCDKVEQVEGKEVNVWKVDHNSIDFTGLIAVLELNLRSDRWFLLHDTLYVGPNFYKHICSHLTQPNVIGMSKFWSKNMGSYSQTYLSNIAHWLLLDYKNKDLSKEAAHRFKTMNINTENEFLKCEDYYTHKEPIMKEYGVDFYKSGTLRDVQYYFDIDIYKIQSHLATHLPGRYNINI